MSTIFTTVLLAFFFIVVCLGLMALGWLVRGKSILRPGACGRDPTKNREEDCGKNMSCSLCEKKQDSK